MNYSKNARFFPNECYECKSRNKLIRCECNMISYCSEDHRQKHLPIHESFCQVLTKLTKEKGLSHIYEELFSLHGSDWSRRREEICKEIITKLGRCMTPLELGMLKSSRICYVCRESKQENLYNCPRCPVATFCKRHFDDEVHEKNCSTMRRYLNIITKSEELNLDLKFLSSKFPFFAEETKFGIIDLLTYTFKVADFETRSEQSREMKINLIDFLDVASKFNSALQKVYETMPEELTIHVDALSYDHAITKENYWEFLLHLNPNLKHLKIIIIGINTLDYNLKNLPLCENCVKFSKTLSVKNYSLTYEDYYYNYYVVQNNYQAPDILFYFKIEDERDFERSNRWSQINCPIILMISSKLNFHRTQNFLSLLYVMFRIIGEVQIKTPFSDSTPFEDDDYFVILQTRVNESAKLFLDISSQGGKNLKSTDDFNSSFDAFTNCLSESKKCSDEKSKESKNVFDTEKSDKESKNAFDTEKSAKESKNDQFDLKSKNSGSVDDEEEENMKNNNVEARKENEGNDRKECELMAIELGKINKNDKIDFRQSFLMKHVLYLKNENDKLRQELNSSVEEVAKLQTIIEEIYSHFNEKNKLLRKISSDIIDIANNENEIIVSLLTKKIT
ncbi:uncharacterized protein LOC122508648 [Leptopilina heterotoma]|uniref:uncharacterized protein LOC122508648 n=1 Tax=Leptopilina heterotoma TaxID=63436 RepID=UPI001CA91883|nr:uncharacterized protein LOC122508648 [Leptopilina heterotoma]